MPLNPLILEKGVLQLISRPSDNVRDAAERFAKSYADYASKATAGGSPATFTGGEAKRMAAILGSSFNPRGNPATTAGAIVNSITAFWLGPPVVFGVGPVVAWGGAATLRASLIASFANPRIQAGLAARKLANALDSSTRLVLAGVTPPGPFPVV